MTTQQMVPGAPESATPDELERWCNSLAAFLASESVPAEFRLWAQAQAARLDAFLASANELDADDADDTEAADEFAEDRRPAARPVRRQVDTHRKSSARRPAAEPWLASQTNKVLLGVAAGALALVVILGARSFGDGDEPAGALPAGEEAAFDEQRAAELEALLAQDPANPDALFELGEMNFQAGRWEDSIIWFGKLIEADPANVHALTDLGTANYNLGRTDEARQFWQRVLDIAPDDVQAHYNMGFLFANAEPRDLAAAIREWELVIQLDPESSLAETARVHVEGLRAESTAAARSSESPSETGVSTPTATAPAAVTQP